VGKLDGRLCRMRPHVSSIANVLAHHGCNDAGFADFISELLQNDPVRRPSAKQALNHGWLQQSGSGTCTKYCLSSKDCGEAGQRLRSKYPSMNNLDSPSSIQSTTDYVDSDELIGPATPQSFREQCYLDRERGERKKVDNKWSRKSIGQRLSGSSLSAAVTHRTAPQLSSSKGESAAHIHP
jgi:serine/threonine protein kinase